MSKTPQILQNANSYSNESSRRNKLICLKGFSGKWRMTFWQPKKSKTCQNTSNFLQNARYSNESSQRKKLICLNGLSDKWKMTFWQPNKSRTCQNASNFAKCKLVIVENSPLLNSIEILAYQPDHFIYVYRYFVLYCLPHNLANTHGSQSDPRYVNVHTLSAVYMPAQKSAQ